MAAKWSQFATIYDPLQSGSIDRTDTDPHDRAIIRASNSRYKPDPTLKSDPVNTVFISRLSFDTTESTLKNAFSRCGKVKFCRIVRDIITGYSKGYGFIEYENKYDAKEARDSLNKCDIDGKEIFVDLEMERTLPGWKPRRLGGGFGGKREAGQLRFGGRDRPFKKPYEMLDNKGHASGNNSNNSFRENEFQKRYRNNNDVGRNGRKGADSYKSSRSNRYEDSKFSRSPRR